MARVRTAIAGFAAGAAFMYLADPNRGRRRRAIARDKILAGLRDVTHELDKARRDAWNRTQGASATVRSLWSSQEADGAVLVDRVRARIGRAVSHPHAVHVSTDAPGRVVLEGPVLEYEVDYLLKSVHSVPGVKELVNRLEVHSAPGNLSSLQGGVPRRGCSEWAQENWTPALRVSVGALAGAGLAAALRYRGLLGWAGSAGAILLLARAVANRGFRQLVGVGADRCTVDFDKTIHIDATVDEVYAYWSRFENFPRFMNHLKEVRDLGNGRSHWVGAGPAGIAVPWDAEIISQQENKLLAWRSVPGSLVDMRGSVRFDEEPDGSTRLTIRMSYCPPAGVFGHVAASLFGADPKHEINGDLVRLKSLIEIGKTRAHGCRVTREEVGVAPRGEQGAW